jgi:toxin CptA
MVVRVAWRPSRLLAAALAVLGMLGACSVLASAMPRWLAIPLALLSAFQGARLARCHLRAPDRALAWPMEGEPRLDGARLADGQLHWRGPLAFLQYRDEAGCHHRLAWWPDTLDGRQRRELRLAAASAPAAPADASMAP